MTSFLLGLLTMSVAEEGDRLGPLQEEGRVRGCGGIGGAEPPDLRGALRGREADQPARRRLAPQPRQHEVMAGGRVEVGHGVLADVHGEGPHDVGEAGGKK